MGRELTAAGGWALPFASNQQPPEDCHIQPQWSKKVTSAEAEATMFLMINYFMDSSTATATETVIPTIGLLPLGWRFLIYS